MLHERNRHKARRSRKSKNNWCRGCDCAILSLGSKCPVCGSRDVKKMDKNLHIENFNNSQDKK